MPYGVQLCTTFTVHGRVYAFSRTAQHPHAPQQLTAHADIGYSAKSIMMKYLYSYTIVCVCIGAPCLSRGGSTPSFPGGEVSKPLYIVCEIVIRAHQVGCTGVERRSRVNSMVRHHRRTTRYHCRTFISQNNQNTKQLQATSATYLACLDTSLWGRSILCPQCRTRISYLPLKNMLTSQSPTHREKNK